MNFITFFLRSLPFTAGMALSLLSLCYLVDFYNIGLDFNETSIWQFAACFMTGFPTLLYGITLLSTDNAPSTHDAKSPETE